MKKHRILAATSLTLAAALCLALAGCGGSSSSSSSSADGASSGGSQAAQSASASSDAESSSAASSSSAAADFTAGNGTLDCEYVTIEVTGQDIWHHSDGTEGTQLFLHIENKTDQKIGLTPTGEWDINGNVGYGLIMEDVPAGGSVDTYAYWTDEDGHTVSEGGIQNASGKITLLNVEGDYSVLARYDFSYTA